MRNERGNKRAYPPEELFLSRAFTAEYFLHWSLFGRVRQTLLASSPDLSREWLLIHALSDELVDHRRVGEGRGIAERVEFIRCDFSQNPTHDFA